MIKKPSSSYRNKWFFLSGCVLSTAFSVPSSSPMPQKLDDQLYTTRRTPKIHIDFPGSKSKSKTSPSQTLVRTLFRNVNERNRANDVEKWICYSCNLHQSSFHRRLHLLLIVVLFIDTHTYICANSYLIEVLVDTYAFVAKLLFPTLDVLSALAIFLHTIPSCDTRSWSFTSLFFFFFINSPSITCCFFRIVFANHTRSTRIPGLDSPFDLQFSQSKEIKPAIIVPEYTHNRSICDRLKDLNVEYDSLRIWSIFIETFTLNLLFSKNNLDIDAF